MSATGSSSRAYEPRRYRTRVDEGSLTRFEIRVRETDLLILAESDLTEVAERLVRAVRRDIEVFIDAWPVVRDTFVPVEVPESAPHIVRRMAEAGAVAGVGPMAAVAGAIAEDVGRGLMAFSSTVIVENGGDVFLAGRRQLEVGLFAGASPLSGKVSFVVRAEELPLAVCTSAGTIGHSVSLGRADAAVVFSPDAAIADATATALGNRVREASDIEPALDWALSRPRVTGAVAVVGDRIGIRGAVRLASA